MNSLSIIGYLTADPEKRELPSGITATTFTVGVTRNRKNPDGDRESDFFRVTTWRATVYCATYLAKGSRVFVRGELTPMEHDDDNGEVRKKLLDQIFALDVTRKELDTMISTYYKGKDADTIDVSKLKAALSYYKKTKGE